jgi:ATP-dependent RNA helicase DeaD
MYRMEDTYSFSEFNISPTILRAIKDMGFEEPTPIQLLAIPTILSGRDVTGQAQTGTGKTAAFGIPAIEIIDAEIAATQVIVLSPTRELAIQTAEEFGRLAHYEKKIHVVPVYGGQPIERQFKALKFGAHIVVGTPGRVLDHINRGTLRLDAIKMIVLDEADQMLDMGFRDDIETIIRETPKDRQTVLFSATLPRPILEISKQYQNKPSFAIAIKLRSSPACSISTTRISH